MRLAAENDHEHGGQDSQGSEARAAQIRNLDAREHRLAPAIYVEAEYSGQRHVVQVVASPVVLS